MSHFCDFCQMEHTSASCYHPGQIKLQALTAQATQDAQTLAAIRAAINVGLDQELPLQGPDSELAPFIRRVWRSKDGTTRRLVERVQELEWQLDQADQRLTQGDAARRPRVHGNGFIQFDLDTRRRLHVWGHPSIPARTTPSPLHDHTFSFTSRVLLGSITNVEYDIEDAADGPLVLHQAEVRDREDTVLANTGRRVRLRELSRRTMRAGESYRMVAGVFHETVVDGPCVTIIEKDGPSLSQGGPSPRVLVPFGAQPDNDFNRYSESADALWSIVADVLLSAERDAALAQIRQELELEKAAHQYTLDMERPCAMVLAKLSRLVAVPEGSSLVQEVERLAAGDAALAQRTQEPDELRQSFEDATKEIKRLNDISQLMAKGGLANTGWKILDYIQQEVPETLACSSVLHAVKVGISTLKAQQSSGDAALRALREPLQALVQEWRGRATMFNSRSCEARNRGSENLVADVNADTITKLADELAGLTASPTEDQP